MRLLMISTDRTIADPTNPAAKRQMQYFDGWEVDIVVLAKGEVIETTLAPGLRVHVVGGASKARAFWRGRRLARALGAQKRYDLVTVQDVAWTSVIGFFVSRKFHLPLHVQDHGAHFSRTWLRQIDRLLRPWAKFVARHADRVRTVSERGKKGFESIGVPSNRIDVISVPVDVEKYLNIVRVPSSGVFRVLCVARLEPEKGVERLLEGFAEFLQRTKGLAPAARLTIAGDGSLRHVLEQKARTFGIENQVVFAGFQKDLRSFYMDADVYVQPSFYEGWGMAVVEAAASGLPIIMTDTGCAGEAIKNEESGIVMRNGMAEEIAEALVTIVSQPEVRKKMAEMARQAVIVLSAQQEFIGRIRESYQGSVAPRRSTGATLICAQAVDERDPLFGFFVGWLRGFAKHRRAIVCALRVSDPPPEISGVEIHRLRTPRTGSKIEVLWNIARISWRERQNYQSVFVRGDSIYLVCFGWLWRLLGKKIVFWYTHYRANSAWFWLGVPWANEVVTAVPESNPLKRAIKIGHHIDTNHFVWREKTNGVPRIVVVGRVSPVKRVPWILDQTRSFVENGKCTVEIVGCATDSEGCEEVRMRLSPGVIWKNTEVPYVEISAAYERSDILISATPASMDKGILEAAASGLIILAATRGILWGLPEDLHWLCVDTDEKMQFALKKVLGLSLLERKFIGQRLRQWVEDSHSQEQHIAKLIALL